MKKSKVVNLVLVAGLLASCNTTHKEEQADSRLYVRGDSASQYSRSQHTGTGSYFHFLPFGIYSAMGGYRHTGYTSPGFSSKATSPHIARGGFGTSGVRVGS